MSAKAGRTIADDGAARERVLDGWCVSTLGAFRDAQDLVRDKPRVALQQTRLVLEGWAHAVCVARDPEFKPYDGPAPRREPLAKVLERASRHLPHERRRWLAFLKSAGDELSHNQGVELEASAAEAELALGLCAELLIWLHREVLRQPVPAELNRTAGASAPISAGAVASSAPRSTSRPRVRRWLVVGGLLAATAVVVGLIMRSTWGTPKPATPARTAAESATTSGSGRAPPVADLTTPTIATSLPAKPDATLAGVSEYERAIASRDVEKVLARHTFPARRWFGMKDASRDDLRRMYSQWLKSNPRAVYFEDCEVRPAGVAVCQVHVDPPLESHPDRVPTCLVFNEDGLIVSRTELAQVPACPP